MNSCAAGNIAHNVLALENKISSINKEISEGSLIHSISNIASNWKETCIREPIFKDESWFSEESGGCDWVLIINSGWPVIEAEGWAAASCCDSAGSGCVLELDDYYSHTLHASASGLEPHRISGARCPVNHLL